MATYTAAIQKLYVAYFNRPADPAGLAFWEGVVTNANGSTTAVAAAFAATPEYDAEYGDLTNTQVVTQVYQNLFGRAPDAAGLAFWVNALDNDLMTVDVAVTTIAAGALNADGTLNADGKIYANKVTAATEFTAAVDTAAEKAGYAGADALEAAKEFISGVTTDASLAAAIAPAALNATVAAVVKAGTPFTLEAGLAALVEAKEAKAEFLAENDLDDDEDTDTVDADINSNLLAAETALDAKVGGAAYVGSTAAIKAALLQDQIDANDAALTAKQGLLEDALDEVADVDGLADAIANLTVAMENEEAAGDAATEALAAQAAALASFNVLNSTAVTVGVGGVVAGYIVLDDGDLVLVDGVTEATDPGVTALLEASIANQAAIAAVAAAEAGVEAAELEVEVLDVEAVLGAPALAAVGAGMTVVTPDDVDAPTASEIQTEIVGLSQLATAARAAADAAPADLALDAAADTAEQNVVDFETLVSDFIADNVTELAAEVIAQQTAVATAEANITDLNDLIVDLDAAIALKAEMTALNAAVTAAGVAFTDADFKAPVTLGAVAAASSGSDIYIVGDAATTTITNFGLQGDDVLYIGSDFTHNTGALTTGNNSVLEVFMIQSGANVKVYLENKAFGSASAAEAETVITLTGVNVADLTLENGIITAA